MRNRLGKASSKVAKVTSAHERIPEHNLRIAAYLGTMPRKLPNRTMVEKRARLAVARRARDETKFLPIRLNLGTSAPGIPRTAPASKALRWCPAALDPSCADISVATRIGLHNFTARIKRPRAVRQRNQRNGKPEQNGKLSYVHLFFPSAFQLNDVKKGRQCFKCQGIRRLAACIRRSNYRNAIDFDQITLANMTAALQTLCKTIPAYLDSHELRKQIDDCAHSGRRMLVGFQLPDQRSLRIIHAAKTAELGAKATWLKSVGRCPLNRDPLARYTLVRRRASVHL
jgi:hypothetical protein